MLASMFFLAACSTVGQATPISTPTPTPTPIPPKVYTGDGFTLTHPHDWKVETKDSATTLMSSDGMVGIVLGVIPGGDPDAISKDFVKASPGDKQDDKFTKTTTIGGQTWKQVGKTSTSEGISMNTVLLITKYPPRTGKVFMLNLIAPTNGYDKTYQEVFKPILDSFKFTS
jgi:hypothetical protein